MATKPWLEGIVQYPRPRLWAATRSRRASFQMEAWSTLVIRESVMLKRFLNHLGWFEVRGMRYEIWMKSEVSSSIIIGRCIVKVWPTENDKNVWWWLFREWKKLIILHSSELSFFNGMIYSLVPRIIWILRVNNVSHLKNWPSILPLNWC